VAAGASALTVHVEAVVHLQRTLAHIREQGVRAGVALNPATPLATLDEILPEVDQVLVMSVNPGFGGQQFLASSLDKIRRLRALLTARGSSARILVDGGIHAGNVREVVVAGAEIVFAVSSVFGAGDPAQAARRLLEAAR
jgi:ribulose-phosphate 3-epimerase